MRRSLIVFKDRRELSDLSRSLRPFFWGEANTAEVCGIAATDCQLCDTRVTLSGEFDPVRAPDRRTSPPSRRVFRFRVSREPAFFIDTALLYPGPPPRLQQTAWRRRPRRSSAAPGIFCDLSELLFRRTLASTKVTGPASSQSYGYARRRFAGFAGKEGAQPPRKA